MVGDAQTRRRFARLLYALHWVDAQGLERIPAHGRVIIALNHSGVRGAMVLSHLMQRDMVMLGSVRFLRFWFVREFAQRLAVLFVSVADMLSPRLYDEMDNVMHGGSMIGIMVPGRQMTQVQGVPKRGAVYLAYRLQADILPISVIKIGLYVRIRVGHVLPRPRGISHQLLHQSYRAVCLQLGIAPATGSLARPYGKAKE